MPIVSYNLSQFKKLFSSKYTCIAIILIVSFGVYLNTMWNGFVYDDEFQVLENPWIKDVRYIHDIFLSHVWAFQGVGWVSNYYRPMMHIILMIDYYLFGLKPWGYHLINIILHAGVSVLVFLIASMLINHPGSREKRLSPPFTGGEKGEGEYNLLFPLIAAILFAAHPIHTEVVAWVSGIPELSFTLFYLLSFYFYIKADDEYGKHFILSILLLWSILFFTSLNMFEVIMIKKELIIGIIALIFGSIFHFIPNNTLRAYNLTLGLEHNSHVIIGSILLIIAFVSFYRIVVNKNN